MSNLDEHIGFRTYKLYYFNMMNAGHLSVFDYYAAVSYLVEEFGGE